MPLYDTDPTPLDILEAMKAQGAFLDITPDDARDLFVTAHRLAIQRLRRSVPVSDLMTSPVITLTPEQNLRQAAHVLASAGISGAPVLRGPDMAGVLSVKDILALLGLPGQTTPATLAMALLDGITCQASGLLADVTVGRVMTSPAVTAAPDTPAWDCARIMSGRGVNRLPVIGEGRLAGIITRTDLLRSFGDLLGEDS